MITGRYEQNGEVLTRFRESYLVVDGIPSRREDENGEYTTHLNLMFNVYEDVFFCRYSIDEHHGNCFAGDAFIYRADFDVDEEYWLKYGEVVNKRASKPL